MKNRPALTLVEVLLVMALIVILGTAGVISLARVRINQALDSSTAKLAIVLRQAHVFSREERDDSSWGVRQSGGDGYQLVSLGREDTILSDYRLEPPIVFERDFELIRFRQGTGETDGRREVVLTGPMGRSMKITVLTTGVVGTERL